MLSFFFAGVYWRVSLGFLLAITAFLLLDSGGFALCFLAAAALHESGHLAAMSLCGAPVRAVELTVGGMRLRRGGTLGYRAELFVMLAGAGCNLLAALLLLLWGGVGAQRFSAANLALAVFHLLPIGGLDGGTVLELLCVRWRGAAAGMRLARRCSVCFALTALAGLCWLCWRYGWSAGVLLLALLLVCALLAPKPFS